jgi:ribose transport system substrate-binding protein
MTREWFEAGRKWWKASLLIALVVLPMTLAACGGGDSSSSSASTEGGSTEAAASPGVETAQEAVDALLETPTALPVDTPLKEKPGPINLVITRCASPVCIAVAEGSKDAADALGWKSSYIDTGATPDEISSAWDEVVARKPDAVLGQGNPRVLFEKQLGELEKLGIPYVSNAAGDKLGGAEIAETATSETYDQRGRNMAQWVVADSNGEANAIFFAVPDYPVLNAESEGFEAEFKKLCPTCKLEVVDVALTSLGNEFPTNAVSKVQRNPEASYVVTAFGDMNLGVPQALRAAGLDEQVKIVSQAGSPANFENISKGLEAANLAIPEKLLGWLQVDAVARHLEGMELPQQQYTEIPTQWLVEDNIEDPSVPWPSVPGFEAMFEELWQLK